MDANSIIKKTLGFLGVALAWLTLLAGFTKAVEAFKNHLEQNPIDSKPQEKKEFE